MGIKAVSKYVSDDGSVHDTMKDALAYEARLKAQTAIKKALQTADPNGTIANWPLHLVMNAKGLEILRDACNKGLTYHRNHGTLRNKKVDAK